MDWIKNFHKPKDYYIAVQGSLTKASVAPNRGQPLFQLTK